MTDKKLSRRNLFIPRGPQRRPESNSPRPTEEPARGRRDGFSLDAFYAQRASPAQTGERVLPSFELRPDLPEVQTVRTGTPELSQTGTSNRHRLRVAATPVTGVVRIETARCLAWQNSFCTVCSEHCPEPHAIVCEQGRPTVDATSCTGCGICIQVCPAPINAFEIDA